MTPTRLSFVTLNLWNVQRWPARAGALRAFARRFRPDVLCVQELRLETRDALEEALSGWHWIEDPFPGWMRESTIFWNSALLEEVQHGAEEIGIQADPYRRLFWARLRVRATGRTLFLATAHFTQPAHPDERATGRSPRVEQAQQAARLLRGLVPTGEPAFFLGCLGDAALPAAILEEAGFQDCYARLGLLPPPTWPALPTARPAPWEAHTAQTLDGIFSNEHARPLAAATPHFFHEDVAVSDHWPVLGVYEME